MAANEAVAIGNDANNNNDVDDGHSNDDGDVVLDLNLNVDGVLTHHKDRVRLPKSLIVKRTHV